MDNSKFAQNFHNKNTNFSKISFEKGNLLPHRYVFVLTNLCNLRCSFCFQERKKNPNRMFKDDWIGLIEKIPHQSRITLTGGEPLAYKGFEEIFQKANKNHYTNIITNGTLLKDEFFSLFLQHKNFKVLSVSIDTLGNTNRDFKKGQWEKLVENLQRFKKKIRQEKSEIVINIKTVVTDENIDQLYNLNKFVSEEIDADTHDLMLLKGADIQHSDVMFKYDDAHKKYKAYEYKNFDQLIDQLNLIRKNNLTNNKKAFLHPNIIPLNSEKKIKKDDYKFLNFTDHKKENYSTCLSPWTSVHVNVDGNVFPCMAFPIGNVKKQSMEEIYFSKISETFKREIKKCGTLPGCNRCGWLKPKVY